MSTATHSIDFAKATDASYAAFDRAVSGLDIGVLGEFFCFSVLCILLTLLCKLITSANRTACQLISMIHLKKRSKT